MKLWNPYKKWLMKLKQGDQSAFVPLYENTAPALMRFLMWKLKGNKALAEDILQETYVKFLVGLDNLDVTKEVALKSYLLQITKNCLIDKVVRNKFHRESHVELEPLDRAGAFRMDPTQEQSVEMRELQLLLNELAPRESEILWLRDGMGMSHKEVGDQLGISEQATRQAYVRARKSLSDKLAVMIGMDREDYVEAY